MDDEVARKALREIDESREAKALRVLSGSCSFEDYKYLCGEIHGLDLAADHIKAVLKKAEEDDE